MTEVSEVSQVTVAETVYPLLLLLSVSVAADCQRCVTEATWLSVVTKLEMLWPLLLLLSVSEEAD